MIDKLINNLYLLSSRGLVVSENHLIRPKVPLIFFFKHKKEMFVFMFNDV